MNSFGNVYIKAGNVNLNNTMIIANTITIDSPNINANISERFGEYFGEVSNVMEISEEDYQYFSDENDNKIPDFFENSINWKYLQDSDGDGVPDIIEKIAEQILILMKKTITKFLILILWK